MTATMESRTELLRPEPPTRERIEQARREQWRTIQDLRRRIIDALDTTSRS